MCTNDKKTDQDYLRHSEVVPARIAQPTDESKSVGFPTFQRQSSFRKQNFARRNPLADADTSIDKTNLVADYQNRILSFHNKWPGWTTIPVFDIAKAGFRYLGPDDKVQCDYCHGILYSWDDTDIPIKEHEKHFSLCPFVEGKCWKVLEQEIPPTEASDSDTFENPTNIYEQSISYATNNLSCNNSTLTDLELYISKSQVIDIVKQMGYDNDIIDRAMTILSHDPEIDCSKLLDVIFSIEDAFSVDGLTEQIKKQAHISGDIPQQSDYMRLQASKSDSFLSSVRMKYSDNNDIDDCQNVELTKKKTKLKEESTYVGIHGHSGHDKDMRTLNTDIYNSSQSSEHNTSSNTDTYSHPQTSEQKRSTNTDNHYHSKKGPTKTNYVNNLLKGDNTDQQNRVIELNKEYTKLKQNIMCNRCWKEKSSVLYLPCRHILACELCAKQMKTCLKCCEIIVATVRVY